MCTRIKNHHTEDACHFVVLAGISGDLPLRHQNANCYVANCSINLTPGGELASPSTPCTLWAGCHSSVKARVPHWAVCSCLALNMSTALN